VAFGDLRQNDDFRNAISLDEKQLDVDFVAVAHFVNSSRLPGSNPAVGARIGLTVGSIPVRVTTSRRARRGFVR